MRFSSITFFAAIMLVLASAPTRLYAQILYGGAVGNVRDASDAAVAGALVTITNTQTNQSRQATTNETGAYSIPTLEPGTYNVRVTKEGFSAYVANNILVTINSAARLDVALAVVAVNEAIRVAAHSSTL